jgi:hypothetical protein
MNIYYSQKTGNTYLVPNHYNKTLKYIKETLVWANEIGLTVPDDSEIRFEVLAGSRHKRMLSIEFNSITQPIFDYIDLDKYPHMSNYLVH